MSPGARHLYVHVPFCAGRCGYCDFVSVVGRRHEHQRYVEALLAELELERDLLAPELETVYLGGGTPSFLTAGALRLLLGALPAAAEVTIEVNPETVTRELCESLVAFGVTRVSLGVQSFEKRLLNVLGRHASTGDARSAVQTLRDLGAGNVSLDLLYGIPGQSAADLDAELSAALELEPEHISCYELEAKPGTRFTREHGAELLRQSGLMEAYLERIVERLTGAGYRWYETASFARLDSERDLRSSHNLGYWRGRDYLGLGVGAVSTVGERRWRNSPPMATYLKTLERGVRPPREIELVGEAIRRRERLMLGLRLDEPLQLDGLETALDPAAMARLEKLGLVARSDAGISLTHRGRFLGDAVSADLIVGADDPVAA